MRYWFFVRKSLIRAWRKALLQSAVVKVRESKADITCLVY
jgi:hypothetical protein